MSGPAQLRPLVAQLHNLNEQTLGMLLTDCYQARHDEGRTSYAAIQLQKAGHLTADDAPQLAAACVFLMRQGNRPGITAGDLSGRLGPFGFEEGHVKATLDVLNWIEQQQPKKEVILSETPAKTNSSTDDKMNAISGSVVLLKPAPTRVTTVPPDVVPAIGESWEMVGIG